MMISAIVTCRDRPRHVERCLSALMAQTAKLGEDFEIILVEQGRASRRLAELFPVTYIGLPYGRDINVPWLCNVGARRASGQYIYNVECDLILESDAIRKVLDIVRGGAIGQRTAGRFGPCRRSLSEEETAALQNDHSLTPDETWGRAWGSEMPILFSMEYYAWLGGYDESFCYGYHDNDMIERVRATGSTLALPAMAWHQWHKPVEWSTFQQNYRMFQRMRRAVRHNPAAAVRNGGRWGLLDKLGPPEGERTKLRPKMSRRERRSRRRGRM